MGGLLHLVRHPSALIEVLDGTIEPPQAIREKRADVNDRRHFIMPLKMESRLHWQSVRRER
jgi:hypothetical protein